MQSKNPTNIWDPASLGQWPLPCSLPPPPPGVVLTYFLCQHVVFSATFSFHKNTCFLHFCMFLFCFSGPLSYFPFPSLSPISLSLLKNKLMPRIGGRYIYEIFHTVRRRDGQCATKHCTIFTKANKSGNIKKNKLSGTAFNYGLNTCPTLSFSSPDVLHPYESEPPSTLRQELKSFSPSSPTCENHWILLFLHT